MIAALASFLIQLNVYGFLRHEYLYYTVPGNKEKRKTVADLKKELAAIEKKPGTLITRISLILPMIFNVGMYEKVMKIVLPGEYNGFFYWTNDKNISLETKIKFKNNYKFYLGEI